MAKIAPTIKTLHNSNTKVVTFTDLKQGSTDAGTGDAFGLEEWGDRAAQAIVTGTAPTRVDIEGSQNNTNFARLRDVNDTDIDLKDGRIYAIQEVPLYTRAKVTGGDGTTNVVVIISASRNNDSRT